MWAIDTRPAFLPPARLDYRREWGRLAYSFMHSWSMIGERRGENDPVQRLSCHCLKSDSPPLHLSSPPACIPASLTAVER